MSKVAKDPQSALVFVGTAKPSDIIKLQKMGSNAKDMFIGLTESTETQRMAIAEKVRAKGFNIPKGAEYGYLDEIHLLAEVTSTIPPNRLVYFQSEIDEKKLKQKLGAKIDSKKVSVTFTGEKKEICVKNNVNKFSNSLEINEITVI